MKKYLRFGLLSSAGLGVLAVLAMPQVSDQLPDPYRSGLQKLRMDFQKIATGHGFEEKAAPGSANSKGGSGGSDIAIFRRYGVGN